MEHREVRLLSGRYDLTTTGHKFLEIGINVGPPSYVEIALRDHRGHELPLSLETWNEKRKIEEDGNAREKDGKYLIERTAAATRNALWGGRGVRNGGGDSGGGSVCGDGVWGGGGGGGPQ
ncbi:PREDICTED: serine/arginine-rich splicing factor 1-like [Acromyrmex echinatior]|uniref:serine/arginine-rich splicing factor 1-like n=1 Tax=Acromyrmex echinatior TaxID=103372 RepID=UPI000580D755|nr:PREDICTED: serine/arginine-rich splicing factor 1-like [Acromyrmex echinatior]